MDNQMLQDMYHNLIMRINELETHMLELKKENSELKSKLEYVECLGMVSCPAIDQETRKVAAQKIIDTETAKNQQAALPSNFLL